MKRRIIALALIASGGFVAARRLSAPAGMPFADICRRGLAERRGAAEADRLVARAQARYDELYADRPRPGGRALRFHLERGILPGLALYQTLLAEGDDQETALADTEHAMDSISVGLGRVMSLLGRLPHAFGVFRRVEPWVVRLGFPAEGWEMEPVENSDSCVAYDVRRCFYQDTLTSYGAPELTRVFCSGDDVAFPEMAPAITWERTMTLGRGGERCDFRWRRGVTQGATSGEGE